MATARPEPGMRIGDAAASVGVSARTLRYYEELGILEPSGYTSGGERRYQPEDLEQLQRIIELKNLLGMNLVEIKRFLDSETRLDQLRTAYLAHRDTPTAKARAALKDILHEAIELHESLVDELDAKLSRMDEFRATSRSRARRCRELLAELD